MCRSGKGAVVGTGLVFGLFVHHLGAVAGALNWYVGEGGVVFANRGRGDGLYARSTMSVGGG